MTTWTSQELDAIAGSKKLEMITARSDGTSRGPVPVWVVRVQDDVYIRSFRGQTGAWYRHTRQTAPAGSG